MEGLTGDENVIAGIVVRPKKVWAWHDEIPSV
jgi:hypothetical protein